MINDTNAYTYPLPHKCGTQTKGYQAGEVGAKTQLIPGAHREKVIVLTFTMSWNTRSVAWYRICSF